MCALTGEVAPVTVSAMKFAPGFGAGFEWIDPNCAFRIGDQRLILRPREGREVWRDTGPLSLLREQNWQSKNGKIAFERPAIMTQMGELIAERILPADHQLKLAVYAVRTDLKMKSFEWVREILRLPFPLLQGTRAAIEAQSALEDAESVAFALRRAIKVAYPREGKGNGAAFDTLISNTEKEFWRELRPHYDEFTEFLARPHGDTERDVERQKWRDLLGKVGWAVLTYALDDMDGNAVALERQTAGLQKLPRLNFKRGQPRKSSGARFQNQGQESPNRFNFRQRTTLVALKGFLCPKPNWLHRARQLNRQTRPFHPRFRMRAIFKTNSPNSRAGSWPNSNATSANPCPDAASRGFMACSTVATWAYARTTPKFIFWSPRFTT